MGKSFTIAEVAETLGGKITGDSSLKVSRVAHPADIRGPEDLVLAVDPALFPLLEKGGAQAAILPEGAPVPASLKAAILVGRSRYAMAKLTRLFENKTEVAQGIHPTAIIEAGAKIGNGCAIGAYAYVCAGAEIGDNCILHPQTYVGPDAVIGEGGLLYSGVRIGARVKIGARCIVHFNTTIGADGFSFVTPQMGSVETAKATGEIGEARNTELVRIASLGAVEIGDDVEIGANTSIDRGTIVSTRIGNGTKIDNQVQIGHNVVIGQNCMLCGRVGIAGSSEIGDRVVLGGAVGIADHVKIGDDSVCMAMSGVAGNLPPRSLVGGVPARPRKKFIQDMFNVTRVKALSEKIAALTKRLDEIEGK